METPVEESNVDISKDYIETLGGKDKKISLPEALKIITDKYCTNILMATSKRAMTATELSYGYGIPIATCHRRIHLLIKAGLLKCVGNIESKKRKKAKIYCSMLKNASFSIGDKKYRVKVEFESLQPKEL